MIAPPLLLMGKPVLTIWRVVPLGTRRVTARKVVKSRRLQSAWRSTGGWRSARAAWLMFIATFVLWHVPYVYDLTLRVPAVHVLEHGLFFATAMNFWARVIPSPPIRRLRERTELVVYLGGVALFDTVFDTLFVAAPQPLYSHYANLVRHPGALSALTDQSIAGGVMNLIGSTMLYGALVITWRSGGAARRNVGAAMRPATYLAPAAEDALGGSPVRAERFRHHRTPAAMIIAPARIHTISNGMSAWQVLSELSICGWGQAFSSTRCR